MIKFVKKGHTDETVQNQTDNNTKIRHQFTITYSLSEIVLGVIVLSMIAFFDYYYISTKPELDRCSYSYPNYQQATIDQMTKSLPIPR